MAQRGIPMANKVGYSMYWSSMWDNLNKSYPKTLKEDIYLRKIMPFFFDDKNSINILKLRKKINKKDIEKYLIHSNRKEINKDLLKYLFKKNKVIMYPSKLWILRYQSWLILFYFIFLPQFGEFGKGAKLQKILKLDDFFSVYSFYKKVTIKSSYSFESYKKWDVKKYF